MKFNFRANGQQQALELLLNPPNLTALVGDSAAVITEFKQTNVRLCFTLDAQEYELHWAKDGRDIWLHLAGHTYHLQQSAAARSAGSAGAADGSLRAPMPGQVKALHVAIGDQVEQDQLLLVLEAMKMELRVLAPAPGRVAALNIAEGDAVEKDQLLVEIEPMQSN